MDLDLDADEVKFHFGQYAGRKPSEVPLNYLLYMMTQGLRKHAALYAGVRQQVIDMLTREAHADKQAEFLSGITALERIADEDLC